MRKLRSGVFLENRYPGVTLGAIASSDGLLLVDSPLRTDDAREWLAQLGQIGRPRYVALLDHHPDRALGGRGLDIPIVAHEETLRLMRAWPDAFKGATKPIGSEADRLKRITGLHRAVPELAFSDELLIHLGDRQVRLVHRPGPMPGAIWVVLEDAEIAFIGDAVTVAEPPYFGEADLERWLAALDELRNDPYRSFTLISSRDGIIEREHLNAMARLLRKVIHRMNRLLNRGDPVEAAGKLASQFMRGLKLPTTRRDLVALRLKEGLMALYAGQKPTAG